MKDLVSSICVFILHSDHKPEDVALSEELWQSLVQF